MHYVNDSMISILIQSWPQVNRVQSVYNLFEIRINNNVYNVQIRYNYTVLGIPAFYHELVDVSGTSWWRGKSISNLYESY